MWCVCIRVFFLFPLSSLYRLSFSVELLILWLGVMLEAHLSKSWSTSTFMKQGSGSRLSASPISILSRRRRRRRKRQQHYFLLYSFLWNPINIAHALCLSFHRRPSSSAYRTTLLEGGKSLRSPSAKRTSSFVSLATFLSKGEWL